MEARGPGTWEIFRGFGRDQVATNWEVWNKNNFVILDAAVSFGLGSDWWR